MEQEKGPKRFFNLYGQEHELVSCGFAGVTMFVLRGADRGTFPTFTWDQVKISFPENFDELMALKMEQDTKAEVKSL